MAETTFVRVKHDRDFSMVNNTFIRDTTLSWKAKGVLVYLLSLPDDWSVYLSELQKHATDGRDSLRSALSELIEHGYLVRNQKRNEDGKFGAISYDIIESPSAGKPQSENPKAVKPFAENPKLLSTNNTKDLLIPNTNNTNRGRTNEKVMINHDNVMTSHDEPAYIKDVQNKDEVQQLISDCFTLITEHNTSGKHKIPVSKALMYFTQKEGQNILYLKNQGYSADEIRTALKNYLKVADSDTWKSMFSFNAFCKNISEYIGEYFDMSKYVNTPKSDEEIQAISQKFLDENYLKPWFNRMYATLSHNRKKWVQAGQPSGDDFTKWAQAAFEEDVKAGRASSDGEYF